MGSIQARCIVCFAAAALCGGCGSRGAGDRPLPAAQVRGDLLEGGVPLPLDDTYPLAGAVTSRFHSIDWENAGGVILLSWRWDGPPCTFVVYCGDRMVSPAQGLGFSSFAHPLWEDCGPGIYHYKVVAEPIEPGGESDEIVCGPVMLGRLRWDRDSRVREVCSHFAVYLRRAVDVLPPLCIYVVPLCDFPRTENSVSLRRIFSNDATTPRMPGERQFLFGETRSAEVAARINVTLGRPLGAPVTDEEVWGYLLARKNSVTATYCNVTAENVPDKDIESPHSAPVWFTYSRSLLYDED
ncbi:MAG TPA: hypothetical protein PKX48_02545 [Planctomycetota bacterium]|nr:hypothetical protein [Planctomycetota bacterium]OQC19922.1 MAG: hypothetical protein BWX69_02312 [Planctomycetes bacterium ADurb.Bin069]HNR99830.1 hypothetical protein [Planctomycetota bacterium]HNU26303.1 hypothetical protein [Planctomycetota bacterium]HOE28874.1 hypothetical protein [Planctomycetota bacterium]